MADYSRSLGIRAKDTPERARASSRDDDDDDAVELDEQLSLGLDCFEVDSL